MGLLKHKGTRLGMVVLGCLQVRAPAPPARSTAACVCRARALRLAAAASGGPWGDTSVTPSFLKLGGMHLDRASPAAMPWQADGAFDPDGGVIIVCDVGPSHCDAARVLSRRHLTSLTPRIIWRLHSHPHPAHSNLLTEPTNFDSNPLLPRSHSHTPYTRGSNFLARGAALPLPGAFGRTSLRVESYLGE